MQIVKRVFAASGDSLRVIRPCLILSRKHMPRYRSNLIETTKPEEISRAVIVKDLLEGLVLLETKEAKRRHFQVVDGSIKIGDHKRLDRKESTWILSAPAQLRVRTPRIAKVCNRDGSGNSSLLTIRAPFSYRPPQLSTQTKPIEHHVPRMAVQSHHEITK